MDCSGAILGLIWGDLGPYWGHLGAHLGRSWAILGHLGAYLGAILGHLGPFWGDLGPYWVLLGHILGPSWVILGRPVVDLRSSRDILGQLGPAWAKYIRFKRMLDFTLAILGVMLSSVVSNYVSRRNFPPAPLQLYLACTCSRSAPY